MSIDVDSLFDHAYNVMVKNKEIASMFARRPAVVLDYAREIWGFVPSYRYEPYQYDVIGSCKNLVLTNIILQRYLLFRYRGLYKHLNIAIVGFAGTGKTTYAINCILAFLNMIGYSYDDAEKIALSFSAFSARDTVYVLKKLVDNRKWTPFILIDDIGTQISKYWVFLGEHYWVYLFSVLDTMKDYSGVLITTAVSFDSIPKRVRELIDIIVDAKEYTFGTLNIVLFRYFLPNDMKHPVFIDVMPPNVFMPDEVWKHMLEVRASTCKRRISLIASVIDKLPEIEAKRINKIIKGLESGEREQRKR
jgi:ACT domain-containing protein